MTTCSRLLCAFLAFAPTAQDAPGDRRFAFFVTGDPQYVAEETEAPKALDPESEKANGRFIALLNRLPGTVAPAAAGGGRVAKEILGVLVTGDLIDSGDKNGAKFEAMQRVEWARFRADYGLDGRDGRIPFPVYEMHGNHDSVRGGGIVLPDIKERNRRRPGVAGVSANGLHYSWDWGAIHLVACGIFAGEGEQVREGHHYNPLGSLEFLRKDLEERVGASGRPVVVSHHLHLTAGNDDWPDADLAAYYELLSRYNVIAVFHGHTHGNAERLGWDGKKPVARGPGIPVFNPDDAGSTKTKHPSPNHGLLYVEILDRPGTDRDTLSVRACRTRDNWETEEWISLGTGLPVRIPDGPLLNPAK
jgi:3',5'-cyclic AMP phosphodiesterase CpdA